MLKYLYLSLAVLLCTPSYASNGVEEVDTAASVTFKDRISIHTNTLGWVLMTPNIGLEYDLVHNKHKKISLLVSGKYNWQMNQKYDSRYLYNVAGARAELRWYFRTRKVGALGKEPENRLGKGDFTDYTEVDTLRNKLPDEVIVLPWEKAKVRETRGFFNRIIASRRLVTAKQNPRTHRAYYVGPYAAYDKYSVKFGDTGYQGSAIGAGVAFGYTTPLYIYNNGNSIDLELGTALGVASVEYDKFGYNNEDKCYTNEGSEDAKILPMISDVHLSLVYRFDPVKNQAYDVDYDKLAKERYNYSLRTKYLYYDNKPFVLSDSLKRAYAAYNREVAEYNNRVRSYNRAILKHENADSLDLLVEQAPLFDYLGVSSRFLDFGSDKTIPNKNDITSIEELGIDQLNDILNNLKKIDELESRYGTPNVTPVSKLMLDVYNNPRFRPDSISELSYYEYMLTVVPIINTYAIKNHNEALFVDSAQVAASDTLKVSRVGDSPQRLVKGSDCFVLKSPVSFALTSKNEEIIADNLAKVNLLKEKYGITVLLDKSDIEEQKKERKAQDKAAKAKAKADEKARKAADKAAEKARKAADKAAKQAREDAEKAAKKAADQAEEQVQELQQENVVEATEEDKQNTEEQTDAEVQDNNNNSEEE